MLKKAHISSIRAYSDEWTTARLAKFTSSKIHYLTYPKGFTDQSYRYIRERVGEELTGEPADREIDTDATRWGHFYEAEGIKRIGRLLGLQFVIVQQLITDPNSRFGSTPDGLVIVRESSDHTAYEVEPLEQKCPPTYDAYISLFECDTPLQLKETKREYYWQMLDQMDACGALRGHFGIYHPKFKVGNHKCITFNYNDYTPTAKGKVYYIKDDLALLRQRKDMALVEFDRLRTKLMMAPAA